jgi:hypothetical protein
MGNAQKHPLRAFTPPEEQELHRIVKATSERMDVVKRARALLCVQAGRPFTEAAREAGYKSGDSISQLEERFNERGLAALLIAPGRGRKPMNVLALAFSLPETERESPGHSCQGCARHSAGRQRGWVETRRSGYAQGLDFEQEFCYSLE